MEGLGNDAFFKVLSSDPGPAPRNNEDTAWQRQWAVGVVAACGNASQGSEMDKGSEKRGVRASWLNQPRGVLSPPGRRCSFHGPPPCMAGYWLSCERVCLLLEAGRIGDWGLGAVHFQGRIFLAWLLDSAEGP